MSTALSQKKIDEALLDLPGWRFEEDKISKTFKFGSFKEAMSFMVRVGMHAEEQKHHPEIFNVYDTVRLSLRTHDAADKVTEKDIELARTIEDFCWI
jgi:4a-hydroxytetrahydrobiopterin dehydratase